MVLYSSHPLSPALSMNPSTHLTLDACFPNDPPPSHPLSPLFFPKFWSEGIPGDYPHVWQQIEETEDIRLLVSVV